MTEAQITIGHLSLVIIKTDISVWLLWLVWHGIGHWSYNVWCYTATMCV